jgi:hypothetical protein
MADQVMQSIGELMGQIHEIKSLVLEMKSQMDSGSIESKPTANVVPLKKAWERLGYVSYAACWNKVSNGHYRAGKEAIDRRKPGAQRPDWYMDIEKCQERDRARAGARR